MLEINFKWKKFFHLKFNSPAREWARWLCLPHDLLALLKNTIKFFPCSFSGLKQKCYHKFRFFPPPLHSDIIQINFCDILFLWRLHADVYDNVSFVHKFMWNLNECREFGSVRRRQGASQKSFKAFEFSQTKNEAVLMEMNIAGNLFHFCSPYSFQQSNRQFTHISSLRLVLFAAQILLVSFQSNFYFGNHVEVGAVHERRSSATKSRLEQKTWSIDSRREEEAINKLCNTSITFSNIYFWLSAGENVSKLNYMCQVLLQIYCSLDCERPEYRRANQSLLFVDRVRRFVINYRLKQQSIVNSD